MAQYNQAQQMFALSSLSNMSGAFKGTGSKIAAKMKPELLEIFADATIQGQIGEWELVWGPVVDVSPLPIIGDFLAINTMYIARSSGATPQYVVAIAGTNEVSKFDWLIEDFWVDKTVTWPYLPSGSETNPQISDGTNFGLNKLLGMQDNGQSARDYLQANATETSGTSVMVTGHSLGGALSPSYALYLHDTAADWNADGNATIFCQPTAGPTPGDENFATYYDDALGSKTNRVWNKFDMVPHAWEKDMLEEVPDLFAPTIEPDFLVKGFVDVALHISRNTPYTQLCADVPGSNSTVIVIGSGGTFEQFMKEACYQHIDAYINIFELSDFQTRVSQILNNGKTFFSCDISSGDITATQLKTQQKMVQKGISPSVAPTGTSPTSSAS